MSPLEGKIAPSSQTLPENLHTYRKEFLGSRRCDKSLSTAQTLFQVLKIDHFPHLFPHAGQPSRGWEGSQLKGEVLWCLEVTRRSQDKNRVRLAQL